MFFLGRRYLSLNRRCSVLIVSLHRRPGVDSDEYVLELRGRTQHVFIEIGCVVVHRTSLDADMDSG